MWRENRRVQAMSWGSAGSDDPPPKPSRVPAAIIGGGGGAAGCSIGRAASISSEPTVGPTTYLVAPNSEILAQLMRDNEKRSDAGMYTAPASAFNTFTVDFVSPSCSSPVFPVSPQHKVKVRSRKQHQQPEYANLTTVSSTDVAPKAATLPRDVRLHDRLMRPSH